MYDRPYRNCFIRREDQAVQIDHRAFGNGATNQHAKRHRENCVFLTAFLCDLFASK